MITQKHFIDWESYVFGYGYGSGEPHIIPMLRAFLELTDDRGYDYRKLEKWLGPAVTWLLINTLCHENILQYGVSPRFAALSPEGKLLKEFMLAHPVAELVEMVTGAPDDVHCLPDNCDCEGEKCNNPLWR